MRRMSHLLTGPGIREQRSLRKMVLEQQVPLPQWTWPIQQALVGTSSVPSPVLATRHAEYELSVPGSQERLSPV